MTAANGNLTRIPYGAVYFRKSNPPEADWERDYRLAAEDGMTTFRHWFMWSAIEIAPGVYDWDDYDRQLDLAAANGIKTIIAEMITAAPEWLYAQRPQGRFVHADGRTFESQLGGSSSTGGFHAMSLDDEVVAEAAHRFLTALVTRYRGHPGLGGYDVWNECNYPVDSGYGPATIERFRAWLRDRYGELRTLARAWGRYSYSDWTQVQPPQTLAPFTQSIDWLNFQADNAFAWMTWRVNLIKSLDETHPVTAHGIAASLVSAARNGADDWRSAERVDSYGYTWVASRQGDADWQQLHAADLTRAASRGKDFWHAEAQGGPLWLQPQVIGRPLEDGRITTAEDLRIWNLTSFCGGARGLLYPRWRPLLNGPLFGAFGPYGMDGSPNEASAMASTVARWANSDATAGLFASAPIGGEVGIVYLPESQTHDLLLQGTSITYTKAVRGAYRGFFDNRIQADFVHIDDIAQYRLLYLPYPIAMSAAHADSLADWVDSGGSLVVEGLPGYFDETGWVGTQQPNHGWDTVLGARQADVIFAPDLFQDLTIETPTGSVPVGAFRQSYQVSTGVVRGTFSDGGAAMIDHGHGAGRTRLIGSYPGLGYHDHPSDAGRRFFADVLDWAGIEQHAIVTGADLTARIFDGAGGRYLWLLNHTRADQQGTVRLASAHLPKGEPTVIWGRDQPSLGDDGSLAVHVGRRDALILGIG